MVQDLAFAKVLAGHCRHRQVAMTGSQDGRNKRAVHAEWHALAWRIEA